MRHDGRAAPHRAEHGQELTGRGPIKAFIRLVTTLHRSGSLEVSRQRMRGEKLRSHSGSSVVH